MYDECCVVCECLGLSVPWECGYGSVVDVCSMDVLSGCV